MRRAILENLDSTMIIKYIEFEIPALGLFGSEDPLGMTIGDLVAKLELCTSISVTAESE